jgi:ATP-dependent RNA helicase RhlB
VTESARALDFESLDLPEPVMRGIREAGFVTSTPIQEAALPLALKGKDVAGQSQTGTGKTAAFLIAAFTRLLGSAPAPASPGTAAPRMLIIAPTRELVVQIEADARLLGRFTPFRIHAVYGGIDYGKQRDTLAEGCDLLVGTPGRLIDYLKQHVWSPRRVEILVIDEADRMFDMGFIADLRFILRRLPPPEKRQSFLFSATLSFRVLELTWEFMNNPAQITIMPKQKTAERVEQTLYHVGRDEKFSLLLGLLRREGGDRVLIFSNTREDARRLEDRLTRNGFEARALTGDVDQRKRLRILNEFKDGQLPVLVASDVASRGLHIEAVSHVINWDLPQDPEDYVHRIGRTSGGQGHQPRRRVERSLHRGHREVHRPQDRGRLGRRRLLRLRDPAHVRGAPTLCRGPSRAAGGAARRRWRASSLRSAPRRCDRSASPCA